MTQPTPQFERTSARIHHLTRKHPLFSVSPSVSTVFTLFVPLSSHHNLRVSLVFSLLPSSHSISQICLVFSTTPALAEVSVTSCQVVFPLPGVPPHRCWEAAVLKYSQKQRLPAACTRKSRFLGVREALAFPGFAPTFTSTHPSDLAAFPDTACRHRARPVITL